MIEQGINQVNDQVLEVPDNITHEKLVKLMLDWWRPSQIIEDINTANEYYMCRNTNILKKTRSYKDQHGRTMVNETLSNQRIPSAFLRTSVVQKTNYGFGKPFSISVESSSLTKNEQNNDKNGEMYLKEWQDWLDTEKRKTIKKIANKAINGGINWAYVWIDDDNKLDFVDVDGNTVYPNWKDKSHIDLNHIIRDYSIIDFATGSADSVNKVEYWDDENKEFYIDKSGVLVPDESEGGRLPTGKHMDDDKDGIGWGKVPFVGFKGNEDELPLLNLIKAHIDTYDMLMSKTADSLIDDIDPVLLLKNISADIKDLQQARDIIKNLLIASVEGDGDAKYLQVRADINANKADLELIKTDISKFASDVNFEDIRGGGNLNQLVIKSMYQALDTYIEGVEVEFEVFMNNIKYFFDMWQEWKGNGTFEQWQEYKLIVTLNRDMMINESAIIDDTVKLMNTGVSQETVDNYNPAVESVEIENARRANEAEAAFNTQNEQSEMFKFIQQMKDAENDNEPEDEK